MSHLLPGDGHVVLHVSEHGRLDEVPSVCGDASSAHQLGSFPLAAADVAQDLIELLLIDLTGDPSVRDRTQDVNLFDFLALKLCSSVVSVFLLY